MKTKRIALFATFHVSIVMEQRIISAPTAEITLQLTELCQELAALVIRLDTSNLMFIFAMVMSV